MDEGADGFDQQQQILTLTDFLFIFKKDRCRVNTQPGIMISGKPILRATAVDRSTR